MTRSAQVKTFYHSTRNGGEPVTSKQAILTGIAPDGGLYVSDQLGEETLDMAAMVNQGYHETVQKVLATLIPDYSTEEIGSCVRNAYAENFDTPVVAPLTPLGRDWLLEIGRAHV